MLTPRPRAPGLPEEGETPNFLKSNTPGRRHAGGAGSRAAGLPLREFGAPEFFDPLAGSFKRYRNPIAVAQEWQRMLSAGECASRTDLARRLRVTCARVTQILGLLDLASEVFKAVAALGDPLPKPIVTERGLRSLLNLSIEEQKRVLRQLLPK